MHRRAFILRIVQGMGVLAAVFVTYPFVRFLWPDANRTTLEINLADLADGATRSAIWRGRKVVVVRRSRKIVEELAAGDGTHLHDPDSVDSVQPDTLRNDYRSLRPEYFVAFSNCTHLGCDVTPTFNEGKAGIGFQCACHQSEYDYAGRVLRDQSAKRNLDIPDYRFVSGMTLELGELDADL